MFLVCKLKEGCDCGEVIVSIGAHIECSFWYRCGQVHCLPQFFSSSQASKIFSWEKVSSMNRENWLLVTDELVEFEK